MRENMYNLKIYFLIPHCGKNTKNRNLNPREIVHLVKFVKIYTRENI